MLRSLVFAVSFTLALSSLAGASSSEIAAGVEALRAAAPVGADVTLSPVTGAVTFFSTRPGAEIRMASRAAATPEGRARAFLGAYARAFGLGASPELLTESVERDDVGMDHVRFRQLYEDVPVTGGELIVHLRGDAVVAANGTTVPGLEGVATTPLIAPEIASTIAGALVRKHRQVDDVEVLQPRLEILNRGVLEARPSRSRLAWFVEVRRIDVREYVWIDARDGRILLNFSQLADAKNRTVYDAASGSSLPGTLVRVEGGSAVGDADSDDAYEYAGATYDYYSTEHGRDSFDGSGGELRSTVDFCPNVANCPYANAFWNGTQMVYGDTYASGDDVVAHELTHAVTERSAGLFYYMQAGALNESFSDIFGETVDQTDGVGNDSPGVKWLMGEDLPIGAIRNMSNPGAFGDPGKVSDGAYVCGDPGGDAGGVHTNSGVPNHAYALMADGGTYNSVSVSGIGLTKAGKIEYRALTRYLVSGSDFLDDANALHQSCMDLIGTAGITGGNCTQVKNATTAVEMPNTPPCTPTQGSVPALCPTGQKALAWASADLETPIGFNACPDDFSQPGWCLNDASGPLGQNATSGTHSLWAYNFPTVHDQFAAITFVGTLPANAKLQFNHSFGFENDGATAYDGGVVEYSVDNGSHWTDMNALSPTGATYNGSITTGQGNPLAGRTAFVRESWGYTATQLDLASLVGLPFQVRFRIATDGSVDDYGWFVDDVRVYTCVADSSLFSDDFESGNLGAWSSAAP